eukprot:TRINITY_DN23821_c0_g1_i1.p1 TRINITY_DN23821_c0_g1~~TRINITY_DN23821_c0_g1_i1.p1  ORF type:complete len:305 (-),score=84.11 TRINITY_DN23821_c0_g1_i1:139-975(-)
MTRDSLQELKNETKPSPIIKEVIEAVSIILGTPEAKWEKLRRLIGAPNFVDRIQRLNVQQNVSREQFLKLAAKLQHPDFDEEFIKSVCVPIVPLATWCRAIGAYLAATRYPAGPEVRPVAALGTSSRSQRQRGAARIPQSTGKVTVEPDLSSLSRDELRRVRDLTVSRPEVGQIVFHGETDCTGLDIERLVLLELGEVLVYPYADGSSKPPVGAGLNKPATITMFQCYPPADGGKLLRDLKNQERYKAKIKQMTEEKGATFLEYDCFTGVWKFSVDHF